MTVTLTLPPAVEDAIQKAARRQGQTTEEAITEALQTLFVPETAASPETDILDTESREQERLQAVFAELRAEARALTVDRLATRAAAKNDVIGEAVADKFRRQGFDL